MENFCLWNPESVELLLVNSGILGFGIPNAAQGIQNPSFTDKDWNPVPGILNPCQGIQNPRLSWITSHRAILNTVDQKFLSSFSLVTLAT